MPQTDAREFKTDLTRWELDLTIELLTKQKFDIDHDEERMLTKRYRDRLKKIIEPTLPGLDLDD